MAEGRTRKSGDKGDGAGASDGAAEQETSPEPLATTETNRQDGRYEVDYLVANAASLLGSRPALVAGALAADDRQTHTLEQAKELLQKHLNEKHDPNEGIADPDEEAA